MPGLHMAAAHSGQHNADLLCLLPGLAAATLQLCKKAAQAVQDSCFEAAVASTQLRLACVCPALPATALHLLDAGSLLAV